MTDRFSDPQDPARTTHPTEELLRTPVVLQRQGWTNQADVDVLRDGPIFRLAVSSRRQDRPLCETGSPTKSESLCSQPTFSRCLLWLCIESNRRMLDEELQEMVDRRQGPAGDRRSPS